MEIHHLAVLLLLDEPTSKSHRIEGNPLATATATKTLFAQ
jgi:hypothetical protein